MSYYMTPGYYVRYSLCVEIDICLSIAEQILDEKLSGLSGDEIIRKLRMREEHDLCKELRSAITIFNAITNKL